MKDVDVEKFVEVDLENMKLEYQEYRTEKKGLVFGNNEIALVNEGKWSYLVSDGEWKYYDDYSNGDKPSTITVNEAKDIVREHVINRGIDYVI